MSIQKARGIVLSSRITGEADHLCKIYTKEYGKREFIFKGLQKSKKRPQIISEPGIIADLLYYHHENRNSYIVNDYYIIKDTMQIRNDLKKIYSLYYLVNLIEKTTGFNDQNKSIFDLLANGISFISKAEFAEHLSAFFSIQLLRIQGILPEFQKCKICGQKIPNGFHIDLLDFHPVCRKCVNTIANKSGLFDRIIAEYIHNSLTEKFASIKHSDFPSESIINFLFCISIFFENYYHVRINAKDQLIAELSGRITGRYQ